MPSCKFTLHNAFFDQKNMRCEHANILLCYRRIFVCSEPFFLLSLREGCEKHQNKSTRFHNPRKVDALTALFPGSDYPN